MNEAPTIQLRKTPYIFTVVTIEDLKEDKKEIISLIKEHTQDVKDVMECMVRNLKSTERTSSIDYANDILSEMGYFDGASERLAEINRRNSQIIMNAR